MKNIMRFVNTSGLEVMKVLSLNSSNMIGWRWILHSSLIQPDCLTLLLVGDEFCTQGLINQTARDSYWWEMNFALKAQPIRLLGTFTGWRWILLNQLDCSRLLLVGDEFYLTRQTASRDFYFRWMKCFITSKSCCIICFTCLC